MSELPPMETGYQDYDLGESLKEWHVYMLAQKNMFVGKLHVCERGVYFITRDDLTSDAIAITGALAVGVGVAKRNYNDIALPYSEIAMVTQEKQMLILKNLVIKTHHGETLKFRFGMLSPSEAVQMISERL